MIEAGVFVALGLAVLFAKLSWRARLWLLSHPLLVDVAVFVLLTATHWGTFSGVMAATIGAFFCSVLLGLGRKVYGFVERGIYYRGYIDVAAKLME